jgi:hypothetical protein
MEYVQDQVCQSYAVDDVGDPRLTSKCVGRRGSGVLSSGEEPGISLLFGIQISTDGSRYLQWAQMVPPCMGGAACGSELGLLASQ